MKAVEGHGKIWSTWPRISKWWLVYNAKNEGSYGDGLSQLSGETEDSQSRRPLLNGKAAL